MGFDGLEDGGQVAQYGFVGEAKHTIALRFEPLGALEVINLGFWCVMTRAVNLDDQHGLITEEIGTVTPDDLLPHKLPILEPPVTQPLPQLRLRRRHVSPALPRQNFQIFLRHTNRITVASFVTPADHNFTPFSPREKVAHSAG